MNINKSKIISILVVCLTVLSISVNSFAHSGRTDSNGGHKDNKNKSGLGSYHYHCSGNPAHLHPNGVCPYSTKTSYSSSLSSSGIVSNSTSSNKKEEFKPVEVKPTKIKINQGRKTMFEGETQNLSATISPSDVTNRSVTWKSSDERVATVSKNGVVTAIKEGNVEITVTTYNSKTDSIKITVEEEVIVEEVIPAVSIIEDNVEPIIEEKENIVDNTFVPSTEDENTEVENEEINEEQESDSSPFSTIATLGLIGGGALLVYKKFTD